MRCAVIIANGPGKRMYPYSEKWHKACLPVCNEPIIARLVRQLLAAGIEDIRIVADEKIEQLRHCLRRYPVSFFCLAAAGTADAAHQALAGWAGDAVVVSADVVLDDCALKSLMREERAAALLKEPAPSVRPQFGALLDGDYVKAIYGQPRKSYAEMECAGAYYLDKAAIKLLAVNPGRMLKVPVGGMPPEQYVVEQTIQTYIEDGGTVLAVKAGYAADVNYPWDLLAANRFCTAQLLRSVPDARPAGIHSSAIIEGRVRLGKNSRIGRNVVVKGDVWIGDDTEIDYGAILEGNSVIGNNCRIMNNCLICSGAIVGDYNKIDYCAQVGGMTLDNVSIVHHAEILALIGSHVDVGAGTMMGTLRFDDCSRRAQAGEYANHIFIGDYSRCGVSNVFYPGVIVGSNCALGPGLIVDKDIDSNSLVLVEQSKITKYWGPEKYGW